MTPSFSVLLFGIKLKSLKCIKRHTSGTGNSAGIKHLQPAHSPNFIETLLTRMQDNTFSVKVPKVYEDFYLPDVNPVGICLLTALAEVSHPAVVSKTTDCDDMKALAALGTLVDFVMFVERRARFATLIETRRADQSE